MALAVAAVLAIAGLSPSSAAGRQTATTLPQLRGINTFHSEGVSGIVLEIPRKVKWMSDNIEIELGKGTQIARVAFRNRNADAELCDLCFLGTFAERSRRGPFGSYVGACTGHSGREVGCAIPEGASELYFLADGPFKVTMRFPELRGELNVTASGEVDGKVERVPAKCITPDCALISGSVVRTIGRDGRPSYAQIQAWVKGVRSNVNPTIQSLTACAYPGSFTARSQGRKDKSPNPEDHPYGCDFTDPRDPAFDEMMAPLVTNSGGLGGTDASGTTHGRQYLGYTIHHREAVPPTAVDAHAMWLNAGIRCRSGNFFDC